MSIKLKSVSFVTGILATSIASLAVSTPFAHAESAAGKSTLSETSVAPKHKMNLRVAPFRFANGIINAEYDYGVADRLTVGPTLSLASVSAEGSNARLIALGARVNFYLSQARMTDSWYMGTTGSFFSISETIKKDDVEEKKAGSALGGAIMVGYQWVWSSGFNLNAGIGTSTIGLIGTRAGDNLPRPNFTSSSIQFGKLSSLDTELTIGYAF